MMKKILFCGGSHLAHAKVAIDQWRLNEGKEFNTQYLITAGVQIRNWLCSGKQFSYTIEGGVSLPNINLNSQNYFFPEEYDYIVIIGNYYLPRRLIDFVKLWNMPMTDAVEKEIITNSFFDVPLGEGKSFKNNLVDIINQHKGGQSQLLLVPDPRMTSVIERLPIDFIEKYYNYLQEYIENKNLKFIGHDPNTVDPINGSTLTHFSREEGDSIHMNDEYWKLQMKPVFSYLK